MAAREKEERKLTISRNQVKNLMQKCSRRRFKLTQGRSIVDTRGIVPISSKGIQPGGRVPACGTYGDGRRRGLRIRRRLVVTL